MQPKKPMSKTAFAAAVLSRAVGDAAMAPARAEAQERHTAWLTAAKERYIERVEGIPPEAAEECAESCFALNCMTGTPGHYQPKPFADWPEPAAAADEDVARWGAQPESANDPG